MGPNEKSLLFVVGIAAYYGNGFLQWFKHVVTTYFNVNMQKSIWVLCSLWQKLIIDFDELINNAQEFGFTCGTLAQKTNLEELLELLDHIYEMLYYSEWMFYAASLKIAFAAFIFPVTLLEGQLSYEASIEL